MCSGTYNTLSIFLCRLLNKIKSLALYKNQEFMLASEWHCILCLRRR